jgi:hypothetical protein
MEYENGSGLTSKRIEEAGQARCPSPEDRTAAWGRKKKKA